ncbi:uncharacterized protein N7511_007300 [Penicillium nucicola]|uniref:uncharacterized protein n=1 Tax=Penicillium nucicola TaxID=1850975 RepID=UPI002545AD95|nr:uncharacterized protein N7511_007300 [Penicillium nucicola]KAJ5757118.1 hypothetical protein N7511_007300 [Penicillium nucicola]
MKVLCLHGYGTNPEVMQYQLSGLKKQADVSWEFHYLSGEVTCPPAPGIETIFPAPYFCYARNFDPESIGASYALLEKTIIEHGPFDGVLGFSQGAAIIAGYLIEYAITEPDEPLPFQFMVLFSPTIPLSDNSDYLQELFGSLDPKDEARIHSSEDDQIAQLSEPARSAISTLVNLLDSTVSITREPRSFYLDHPLSKIPCVLHPELCTARLPIPALHIRGKNDFSAIQDTSMLIQSFCNSGKQRVLEHTVGHDIPREGSELRQILTAMEWVVTQSQLPTY